MAVEAQRLHPLFPSQFSSSNREIMNTIEANVGFCDAQMRFATNPSFGPLSTAATADSGLFNPICNIAATTDCFVPQVMNPAIQSVGSSVTFNGDNKNNALLLPASSTMRKRSREGSFIVNPFTFSQVSDEQNQKSCSNPLLFLGHDISLHVQQQQLDAERLVSDYMERIKMEIEVKRRRQGRRLIEAIEQGLTKRVRAKDEEIEKMGKLNMALEEKVKSLYLENQIWRDLAQSSEATANALRSNLQQMLAAVERSRSEKATDDAQSCCGSTREEAEGPEEEERRRIAGEAQEKKRRRVAGEAQWMCKNCDKGEASVLMLPCRHLCLCTVCGSSLHTCPVCKSVKNASVHVNLSS